MSTLVSTAGLVASTLYSADGSPSVSDSEGCRMSTKSPCSSNLMGSFQLPLKSTGITNSWLRSGRLRAWRRSSNGDVSCWFGHPLGVAKAGSEEGGQTVAPETISDLDISIPSPEMILQLQLQMQVATVRENYAEAARLRDIVKSLQGEDPVVRLKALMEKAIAEERYDEAATYRDELGKISPPKVHFGLQCHSDTTTKGIRVQVRSVYVKDRSRPCKQQYYFAYRIRISNEALQSVQLLSRHWIITDENGKVEQARGLGVIGEQPVLLSGTSFEYTSACPLRTSTGKMEGTYQMKYLDERSVATFDVRIGPFALSVNGDAGDSGT